MAEVAKHIGMATKYVDVAGNAVYIGMARVAGYAGRGGDAGAVRQHASDGRYECTVCGSINARLDTTGVADGAYRVASQTALPWACWLCLGGCRFSGTVLHCWI